MKTNIEQETDVANLHCPKKARKLIEIEFAC